MDPQGVLPCAVQPPVRLLIIGRITCHFTVKRTCECEVTVDPRTSDPLGSKPAFLRAPASATDRATDPTNFLSPTLLMSD